MEQVFCKNIQWEKINVWCCGAFFPSGNIKQHQYEAHSDNVKTVEQPYLCGICGKSFSRDCAARIHERIHKSQLACDFCNKGFHQRSFLEKHKKICQLSLKSCSKLKKSSVTTNRIRRESPRRPDKADWRGKKNTCDVATNIKGEGMSKNVNHGDTLKCSEDELADNVKFCENNYQNVEQFKEQEKSYPKERKGKIRNKEICYICGALIASNNMSKHVKYIHTMKDVKNFSCQYCRKSFKLKKDLACHTARHTGQKNFSCSYCDKKFIRKYEAKYCENKHNGIFRLSCHLCEYKTNRTWSLKYHINTHLNIKPYKCPVCRLKSGQKSDLRHHVRTQHKAEGSIMSRLEVLYPQMYDASESNEGLLNDPLFQNLVLVKRPTRKSKWKYQESVKYPTIVHNNNNNSATKKKIKLFSPKSQKSELFSEVDESGLNETRKRSKVPSRRISKDFGSLTSYEHSVTEVNQTI